jgi:DNA-binding transcriptional LysR family regulator
LAEELHFGRAAQRLNITQPALSQLIRDLESRLGFRVVERTTRKVLLTPAGQRFLGEAEAIIIRLDRAIERAQEEAGQAANTIRIGAILPTTFEFLPLVLKTFRRRYPEARVYIDGRDSPQLATAVETGSLHVALLRPPKNPGTLHIEMLRRETFAAAMREDHKLATYDSICLRHLVSERLLRILRPGRHESFDEIERQMEGAGIDPTLAGTAESTLTALALVSAGDGIALVPSWVTTLPWSGLRFQAVGDLSARIDLSIAWEGRAPLPIVQHFIDVAKRVANTTDDSIH